MVEVLDEDLTSHLRVIDYQGRLMKSIDANHLFIWELVVEVLEPV